MTDQRDAELFALIDELLDGNERQSSPERGYGRAPAAGECWRCDAPAAADSSSGMCGGCRAFLLEDSDVDPAAVEVERPAVSVVQLPTPEERSAWWDKALGEKLADGDVVPFPWDQGLVGLET